MTLPGQWLLYKDCHPRSSCRAGFRWFPWISGLTRYKVDPELKQDKRVQPRPHVVHHDACSSRQLFQTAQGERLHYVKATKEYKTGKKVFPIERNTEQRNQLARHLVDHHKAGVFAPALPRHHGRSWNAEQRDGRRQSHAGTEHPARRQPSRHRPPERNRDRRGPGARTRLQLPNAEERGHQPGKSRLVSGGSVHVRPAYVIDQASATPSGPHLYSLSLAAIKVPANGSALIPVPRSRSVGAAPRISRTKSLIS